MAISLVEKKREREVNHNLVTCLERMLDQAKSGEMTGICAVHSNDDDTITTVVETRGNHFAVSHGLSALWFRFQMKMAADSED